MNVPRSDSELDAALNEAFAQRPSADFDAWRRQHADALACLDPRRVAAGTKNARTIKRAALFAAAAVLLVCVWLGVSHLSIDGRGSMAFAQIFEQLKKAKTITWTDTYYQRVTSANGKRTWLKREIHQMAYKSPGLYREVGVDDKGQTLWIETSDVARQPRRQLSLVPSDHKATLRVSIGAMPGRDPRGPFEWVNDEMKDANLQWVETRQTVNGPVNVFRHAYRDKANGRDWSSDFWIDQRTKQLVELHVPGSDIFNYEKEADRNNAPEKKSSVTVCPAHIEHNIVLNADLDDSLFSVEPPKDYALTTESEDRDSVTEKDMIDYLGALADFNRRTFPDQVLPFEIISDRVNVNKAWAKPEKDRTAAEQRLIRAKDHYTAKFRQMPTCFFIENQTVPKSFRYLGNGVKLGDKDRIVCWYKPKDAKSNAYRVVYGDLSVKNVDPTDLPLPVDVDRQPSVSTKKTRTMTWQTRFFEHRSTSDEKQVWLHTFFAENAYKSPGLYREVRFDDEKQVEQVQITDTGHGLRLTYFPKDKKATITHFTPSAEDSGPFASTLDKLNSPNLQWIEKRKTADGEANVFRHAFPWYVGRRCDYSYDFWIDTKTKRLIALHSPGADVYDADRDPARNAPSGKASCYRAMGGADVDIRYDVALDDSLFRLNPPQGYTVEVKDRGQVSEKEMVDYFGILANFNDKTFPDQAFPSPWNLLEKLDRASKKPQAEQTPAERKLLDTDMRYGWRFGTTTNAPILVFFAWNDSVVENSFRYLGKGVRLGDKSRIVCWYKLKNAKDTTIYRVLYGDLSVKDVAPKDLPISVEP